MRLSRREWFTVGKAVGFVGFWCGDMRGIALWQKLGDRGEKAAAEGIEPRKGPARYEIIHALRALVVEANRCDGLPLPEGFVSALVKAEDTLEACDREVRVR